MDIKDVAAMGGRARAKKMTEAERSEHAKKMVEARTLLGRLSKKQRAAYDKGTPQEQKRALEHLRLKSELESNPPQFLPSSI